MESLSGVRSAIPYPFASAAELQRLLKRDRSRGAFRARWVAQGLALPDQMILSFRATTSVTLKEMIRVLSISGRQHPETHPAPATPRPASVHAGHNAYRPQPQRLSSMSLR